MASIRQRLATPRRKHDYFLAAFLRVAFFLVAFFFVAAFLVAFFLVAFRLEAFFRAAITGFPPLSIARFVPVYAHTSYGFGSSPLPSYQLGTVLQPTWVFGPHRAEIRVQPSLVEEESMSRISCGHSSVAAPIGITHRQLEGNKQSFLYQSATIERLLRLR